MIIIFDASKEAWVIYVNELNRYFIANDVQVPARSVLFLFASGPKTLCSYKLVRSLVDEAPDSKII